MFETTCLDENGNTVYSMTQYDTGQKLILELSNITFSSAPEIHFCNRLSKQSLPVQSTLSNNQIIANIPNILLEQPYPLIAYVCATEANNTSCKKTVSCIKIPINKRIPPSEYNSSQDDIINAEEVRY